ncbi:Protein LSM12 -like protein [Sarcoptes scabiei]|uniref:Protein LSM12 -like protein n=1 Tax=Sarcoptes scabiei TaxID=52283 RepID=A0A834VI44_SARSC|nr:Protein LSM12 -like protein [Sarcoptes scabiei]UXI21002.1 hypothetical protein NH340_JMT06945 [Sarcoptes scabiei]
MSIRNTEQSILNHDLMFTVGSTVQCKTCFDEIVVGEVLAFEYKNKILMLKISSNNINNDIVCINLGFCGDIKILKDISTDSNANNTMLPDLNTDKLEERANAAIRERNNLISAYKSGVSFEGISLYLSLSKTMGESVELEKLNEKTYNIVIKKSTKIIPPYRADCVQIESNKNDSGQISSESVKYARKLVEKFWRDLNKNPYTLEPLQTQETTNKSSPSSTNKSAHNQQNSKKNENNTNSNNRQSSRNASMEKTTTSSPPSEGTNQFKSSSTNSKASNQINSVGMNALNNSNSSTTTTTVIVGTDEK